MLFVHLSMGQMGHSFSRLFSNSWQLIPEKPPNPLMSEASRSLFVLGFGTVPSTMKPE